MQQSMRQSRTAILLIAATILCLLSSAVAEPKEFRNWPKGASLL
jgi:hypothetical protein